MLGSAEIRTYHRNLALDVRGVLGWDVTICALSDENWHKVLEGSEVGFELVPTDHLGRETALRRRGEDATTHRVFVLPLCTRSSACAGTFWVSWHETWQKEKKKGSKHFILLNSGWTLFEGLSGNSRKSQVLRVDWDQLPHKGSPQAGHPHWHFDDDLFISAGPATVEVAPGLIRTNQDTAPEAPRKVSMGFIHLAMGAWNRRVDHPGCWQRTYEDDCQQLRDWSIKTLKYLKEQVAGS
jgi:hypothetical protein